MCFCCSGLCQQVSSHCLLLWEPTDKASAQGKLSLLSWGQLLNSEFHFLLVLMSLFFFYSPISLFFFPSSLSQWVHACDAMQLPAQQREHLDSFIDQLYKDIEKGRVLSLFCSFIGLNDFRLHWIDLLQAYCISRCFYVFWIHVLNCAVISL